MILGLLRNELRTDRSQDLIRLTPEVDAQFNDIIEDTKGGLLKEMSINRKISLFMQQHTDQSTFETADDDQGEGSD